MRKVNAGVFAVAAALMLSGATLPPADARAQEAIPTAPRSGDGGVPVVIAAEPLRLSDRPDRGPEFLRPLANCGGPARNEDGSVDKAPHGEVWAGVGNHGYREAGGVVCLPLGENGSVTVAVDAGQINGRRH